MLRLIPVLVAVSTVTHAASPVFEAEPADLALTRRAYAQFLQACPKLSRAVQQSSEISVMPTTGYPNYREEYGWKTLVVVRMELATGRDLMPPVLVGSPAMRSAWFVVAGPPRPGVLPVTGAARTICGLKAARQEGEQALIAMPTLSFLRGWPSDRNVAPIKIKPGCPDPNTAYRLGEGPPLVPGCP